MYSRPLEAVPPLHPLDPVTHESNIYWAIFISGNSLFLIIFILSDNEEVVEKAQHPPQNPGSY